MSMDKIIGIDPGMASRLASVLADDEPVVITMSKGRRLLPSMIDFMRTGERWLSPIARRLDDLKPKIHAFSIRSFIGQHFGEAAKVHSHVPFRVVEAPARDGFGPIPQLIPAESLQVVSAMILQMLKQDAEAQLGEPVTQIVIHVLEYSTDLQRQPTQAAGKIAGLEVLHILNEPAALVESIAMPFSVSTKPPRKPKLNNSPCRRQI